MSAVALTGAVVLATMAWAHMSALSAAYGPICGSGAGLAHCPACYGAVALLLLGYIDTDIWRGMVLGQSLIATRQALAGLARSL